MAGDEEFPSRSFRLYRRAGLVASFGTYVTLFALQALVVLTLHGSAAEVGWLSSARWLPFLVVVVLLYGTASVVNGAAEMAFLPRLVRREHLQRAHARGDGADAAAMTAGPAVADLLVRLLGAPLAVLVDGVGLLVAAAVFASVAGGLALTSFRSVRAPV